MNSAKRIIECLDSWMKRNNVSEVTAVQAAEILDRANILKDNKERPGLPLRRKLRNGEIPHAYQKGVFWYIPCSLRTYQVKEQLSDFKLLDMKNMDNIVTTKFESTVLLDRNKHQPVLDLVENMIPNESGLYSIRVDKIEALPEEFRTELKKRDDTLLYIWKATRSIRERLWEEELHAQRPATFFRSIGAVLGYFPPIGSLLGKRNQHNYKFSPEDREKIIQWIETHILVNFVVCKEDIDSIEKNIIEENRPIMNIQNNPIPFKRLIELRKQCIEVAKAQAKDS